MTSVVRIRQTASKSRPSSVLLPALATQSPSAVPPTAFPFITPTTLSKPPPTQPFRLHPSVTTLMPRVTVTQATRACYPAGLRALS